MIVSGATRVAGVIGDPVRHSRSPAIFNAAFAAAGLDWVYVAFPVPAGRGADAVRAMPFLDIAGLNVTMPHKADAASACDALSDDARTLDAVNTVVLRPDGTTLGDSTDGPGFLRALADESVDLHRASVCVLGAGGAARSIALAAGRAGAFVTVAARNPEAGATAAALAPDGRTMSFAAFNGVANEFDVVVNATPIGMQGEEFPIVPSTLRGDVFVFDTVYSPATTPLVAAATAAGRRAVNGLGMLVHQAALSFERFTGVDPPVDVMRDAATDS